MPISQILDGTYDADLDSILDAVKMRKSRIAKSIGVGTRVRVTSIRPKYLVGATGTIVGRNRTTFDFKFDDHVDTGRFGQQVRMPMTAVEVI